jgi:ankyrin repeat protein
MPDAFQSLIAAILIGDLASVRRLLDDDGKAAVRDAATEDHYRPGIMHWIYAGDTALHAAAAGYQVVSAGMLLTAGADIAAAGNRRRSQPLHYAADGHADSPSWNPVQQALMIRILIEAGAGVNAQDKNGATPLHRAVRTRCAAAVASLLNAGADPRIRNNAGSTPFHLAVQTTGRGGSGSEQARAAQREILRAFLERGASPQLADAKGRSVLDWAKGDWIRQMLAGDAA